VQVTYGYGGSGLLVSSYAHVELMIDDDGWLNLYKKRRQIGRFSGFDGELATAQPTLEKPGRWRFGPGGPSLELLDGLQPSDVAAQFDIGLPDSPWRVLAPGFYTYLPKGLLLLAGERPGEDFELHLPGPRDQFLAFQRVHRPATEMTFRPAAGQDLVSVSELVMDGRIVIYTELAYEVAGVRWRQRFYAAPYGADRTIVVRAQAHEANMAAMFAGANLVAGTIDPAQL
jgi:hypothetical protein